MRHSFIPCAAIATLAAGIIFAQFPRDLRPRTVDSQEARNCPMRAHPDVEHLSQILNLTDTQKVQMRKIFQQARQSRTAFLRVGTCLGRVKFPSKPSIPFRVFSVFPITWGICSSLDGQPQRPFQIGF